MRKLAGARPKAVSFQILGVGEGRFITLVLFDSGAVVQIEPTMIPAKGEAQ